MNSTTDPTTQLLKASIRIEDYKRDVEQFQAIIANKDAALKIFAGFIFDNLDTFEALFSSDESVFTPEQMQAYIQCARHMEARFQRKGMVRQVTERMNALPY